MKCFGCDREIHENCLQFAIYSPEKTVLSNHYIHTDYECLKKALGSKVMEEIRKGNQTFDCPDVTDNIEPHANAINFILNETYKALGKEPELCLTCKEL